MEKSRERWQGSSAGRRVLAASGLTLGALVVVACAQGPASVPEASTSAASLPPPTMAPPMNEEEDDVPETLVHFTAGSTVVAVAIHEDTPSTRDFLSMLPMTLTFEDFNGMEKIAYPPRGFDTTGNEGMAPRVGDLFSYIPWGNLGFFYDTGSLGFSQQLVRIGTTEDLDAVVQLDGQEVTIDIAR